jgi:hypothetical protein
MFNGLMQIPGRENRRAALRELHRVCRPGAPILFTTHDRDSSPTERAMWRLETLRWVRGDQDPRLVEFGDRYFEDAAGRTFMHLPDRREILEDLAATGVQRTPADHVKRLAELGRKAGLDGIVCSGSEVRLARDAWPKGFSVVPGVRPTGSDLADQKRVVTPHAALHDGASIVVIGRPITEAEDPATAIRAIAATL